MCERMLHVLEAKKYDTASLRCLAITGGKVHPAVLERLKREAYAEYLPHLRFDGFRPDGDFEARRHGEPSPAPPAGRSGASICASSMRINRPVKVGEVGEIICQSPLATHGYYKNPEATDASFRDGWFYTGDLGYFDEEGYLFVAGRKKDMVKSGGISIYPLEIESVIYSHPAILEAAVIGVPDTQWGEAVKAVVVVKPEAELDAEELAAVL